MKSARHPYRLSVGRQLATADAERHIADLVRIVLLTGAGERLHHPDFGAGLSAAALFEPLDQAVVGVIEVRARGSLERALGDRIEIIDLRVGRDGESTINASVSYRLRPAGVRSVVEVAVAR